MLKVVRIALYSLGGFFLCLLTNLSFVPFPANSVGAKLKVMVILGALAAAFIFLAVALKRFREWRLPVGIICLGAAVFGDLGAIFMLCLQYSPSFQHLLTPGQPLLNDFWVGVPTTVLLIALGYYWIRQAGRTALNAPRS